MIEEFKKLLIEAEAHHDKLVVLHATKKEQVIALENEEKRLVYLLSAVKGQIDAYKKSLEIMTNQGEG